MGEKFTHLKKVKSLSEITSLLKKAREQKKIIVTLNGCFDLLHTGHIYIIQEAKKQGDILVVGLNSNISYKAYKDKKGPLLDEKERAIHLASLEDVDYVVLFDEITSIPFVEAIKPDIHCNGAEYGKNCIEANALKKIGAKLHLVEEIKDDYGKISSTKLKNSINNFLNKK